MIAEAAKAKAALQGMSDAAKAEGVVEVAAATKAAAAHKADTLSIKDERHALESLASAAKMAQQWTAWGGRTDPGAYLADQAKTLDYKRLINIQNWLGFTSPQAAYAWREKERLQAMEMNKAVWGGYTSPDQYLGYLQKQRTSLASLNTTLRERAQIYRDNADAALAYVNALAGTHKSASQLGDNLDLTGVNRFQSALSGLPDVVTTRLAVDDAGALVQLAQYEAMLRGIPRAVSTSEVLTSVTALGGMSLDQKPQVIPVSYGGPYKEQFAAIMAEVAGLSRLRAQIPVSFELPSAAEVASFVSQIPTVGVTEPVHLAPSGGAVGVGPGPPPQVIAAWNALSGAEAGATTEAKLASVAEMAAGAGAAGAVPKVAALTAAWNALSAAEKTARLDAALGPPVAGGGGAGKPPAPPPAAAAGAAAEPPSDAAAKWAALAAAEKGAGTEAAAGAAKFAALGASARDSGDEAAHAAAGFGAFSSTLAKFAGFGTTLAVFGGLAGTIGIVHLIIDAIIELIAVAVLAVAGIAAIAAALALFAAAGQQAAQQVVQRLQAVRVAATATGQAIYPLTGAFAQLQNTARPAVWQLYGDALNLVGNHANALNTVVQKTGNYLDQLAAKIIVFVSSPGFQHGLTTLVKAGVGVLQQLGDIIRNLGSALVQFARVAQVTHIAEDLLAIINAGAALLALVLKLPVPLLAVAIGLHAFYLWGGLLATGLIALLDPLRAVAVGLGGIAATSSLAALDKNASAWARLKAVLQDVGNGFAAIPARITGAGSAVKAAGADMALAGDEAALMSGEEVAATAATGGLAAAVGRLGVALKVLLLSPVTWLVALSALVAVAAVKISTAKDATQQWINAMNTGLGQQSLFTVIGKTVADLAAVTGQLTGAQHLNAQAVHELSGAQTDLTGKLTNELVHVGGISKAYGVDMPTALALLNTAGVKTSALFTDQGKVWAAAKVQVAGLVQGYAAMGQGLTQLQGDVSVQLVMNADQLKQMQTLNTAWDSWLKLVESGPSAFVSFEQGVQTVTTNMKAAGASFGGTSAASLTLRASWDSLIPTAGNVLDAVRSYSAVLQNGADGSALLVRATRDVIASSGQMATTNQQVRNSLIAVAEQANPAINTWQKLTQWIGPMGAARATSDLDKVMTLLQTPVSNLQKDAALLTTTLQADLNPAMATATFNALGGQKAFGTFAADLAKFGPNAKPTIDAAHAVAVELIAIDKNAQTAHDQFVAWATSMGLSKDAANKLWAEVSKGVTPLNAVRDGLAQSATHANDLAKSGLWAQMRDLTTTGFAQIGHFFGTDIPNWTKNAGVSIAGIWAAGGKAFDLQRTAVNNFFTTTIPADASAMGKSLSGAWATVSQGFLRDVGGPVGTFFSKTVPADASAMSGSLAGAWKAVSSGFMTQVGTPLSNFFTKTLGVNFGTMGSNWLSSVKGMAHDWITNPVGTIEHTFVTLIPGWFSSTGISWGKISTGMGHDFSTQLIGPLTTFFTKTVPGWFGGTGTGWSSLWSANMKAFQSEIITPFLIFFTKTIPAWYSEISAWWAQAWSANMKAFQNEIITPFLIFFTRTVPGWFGEVGRWWASLWSGNMKSFQNQIINPFSTFFTHTIPSWFGDVGKWWGSLWSSNMRSFQSTIINPLMGFFGSALPNALKTGMRDGVNWVINNVINRTVDFINNDILSHLPGSLHVSRVGNVAAGGAIGHAGGRPIRMPGSGSIPGTGDEDGTHIIAMGGEYMLRKPARMALESKYGSNFLNTLNQADSWLGSGSRGNMASQRPRRHAAGGEMAAGGDVNPIGRGLRPERIDMGVDYGGAGPLYALNHGMITNLYNSGWPGGGFIGLRLDQGPEAGKYWFYAEDVSPLTNIGATVGAGQHIANATGGSTGIEVGFAAPPGSGQTMAAATGESAAGQRAGDPGKYPTGWGVAASNLIASLGGPRGILSGPVQGGTPGIAGGFGGILNAIWQSIEGLLDSAGTGLGSLIKPLAGLIPGGASELLKLAQQGATAIFNVVWDHSVKPILGLVPGDTIPGALVQAAGAMVRTGIDNFMSGQDNASKSSAAANAASNAAIGAGTPGPGGGNAAANAALAQKLMPAWGSGTEWLAWNALEMAEAGWNQFARNPSSGAYGIPQALPPSKMGAAANPPQSNPTAQINWMISYIKSVYGDPIGANRHENMFHWYAGGGAVGGDGASMDGAAAAVWPGYAQGDVIAAIESVTGNQEIREAMALGSYLESGWNDTAVGDAGTSFGPWQIHLPAHPGVTAAQAENPAWAAKYMLPAYTSGVNAVPSSVWSSNPETAAETAAYNAERPAKTYFASQGTSAVNTAWNAAQAALGTSGGAPAAAAAGASSSAIPSVAPHMAYAGITVPDITGHQAGSAHNMLVAAGLVPTAADGQRAYWNVTGSVPLPDSAATEGMSVAILADPSAGPQPIKVPDLKDYTAGTAHDILVAAGFIPTAASGQKAWWKVTGTSPAAGSVASPGSKVTILATASIVLVPILAGYQAGAAHDALAAAGLIPTAAAGQRAFWYVTGTSPAGGSIVAPGTRVTILANATAPSPGGGAGGIGAAANWPAASAALPDAMTNEVSAFWALNATPVNGASTDQWASWYADLGILQTNQGSIAGSWNTMGPLMSNPAGLTKTDWVDFNDAVGNQVGWLYDQPTPPSSVWGQEKNVPWPTGFRTSAGKAPGQIPPSGWAAWKYAHPQWSAAVSAAQNLKNEELAAYGAWDALWGPAGSITTSPPTPGLQVLPVGGGPITINLEPLIPGGPAFPVMALSGQSLSSSGSGFAAGGGLDDIAGLFAFGGGVPSPAPVPQMSQSLASGGGTEMPRTLSEGAGGAGGDRIGVKVGNLTINNPVPEKPSDSITRSTNRLAFLAGRGAL